MDKRAWKVAPELIDRFLDVLDDNGFKWMSGHRANELEPLWKNATLLFIKEKPKTLVCMRYLYYQIESDEEYNIIEVTEKWLDEAVEFPKGYGGNIRPRSSTSKKGFLVHEGTIDNGYHGEIIVTWELKGKDKA